MSSRSGMRVADALSHAQTADKVRAIAQASIKYPVGGIKLGDWKVGRELVWSGFGFRFRIAHNADNHAGRAAMGVSVCCHVRRQNDPAGDFDRAGTGLFSSRWPRVSVS